MWKCIFSAFLSSPTQDNISTFAVSPKILTQLLSFPSMAQIRLILGFYMEAPPRLSLPPLFCPCF